MAAKAAKPLNEAFLTTLQERFTKNEARHKGILWDKVEKILKTKPGLVAVLQQMEASGGEPDVVAFKSKLFYVDCSKESPAGRRSLCYDTKALNSRKENKPSASAEEIASEIGIEILTEQQYRLLQEDGEYDLKTSSWIQTPDSIRKLGGALFCDKRYNHVFTYHNGAESYYAARGFRGCISLD